MAIVPKVPKRPGVCNGHLVDGQGWLGALSSGVLSTHAARPLLQHLVGCTAVRTASYLTSLIDYAVNGPLAELDRRSLNGEP